MTTGRVLVVDDLPDVRSTIAGLLADAGLQVCSAGAYSEALQLLRDERFDIAVLDVRLDESDEENRAGLLLMHDIKRTWPSTTVIILTGYADVKMVQEALQPGRDGKSAAFGFLEKTEIDRLPEYVQLALEHTSREHKSPVKRMIMQGETQHQEFKSSIRWDYRTSTINKALGEVVAAAVAGMMNAEGGALFIGVGDDGTVLGIESDLATLRKRSLDGFQLTLTDILEHHIGVEHLSLVKTRFEQLGDKQICVIDISRSPRAVFVDAGSAAPKFYVRVGNSTRSLDVKEAVSYSEAHWKGR